MSAEFPIFEYFENSKIVQHGPKPNIQIFGVPIPPTLANDAYKLGYLHYADETASFYEIEDGNIETLCHNLFHLQGEQVNAVNIEGIEEQVAEEEVAEEDRAKDAVDEMVADVAEQVGGAAEGVADQVDAEEATDQRSSAGVSK
ncbi:hypothetical protein L3X38_004476 [Prunus dulcis]|uniref:Uncharacterized protein n=1 Tax=Prunus dulcis TaxID=3755 RepID=A0AAD4ZP23_PRUDU|nr:hypothetical protein L3X38_004476 [Prunus dulcis]